MDKHYLEEIKLLRELDASIEQLDEQYRNIIPRSIWQSYLKLKNHYHQEIENGVQ